MLLRRMHMYRSSAWLLALAILSRLKKLEIDGNVIVAGLLVSKTALEDT